MFGVVTESAVACNANCRKGFTFRHLWEQRVKSSVKFTRCQFTFIASLSLQEYIRTMYRVQGDNIHNGRRFVPP